MSNDPIDYQRLRAQTEERLRPMLRLQHRWVLLFTNIVAYGAVNFVLYFWGTGPAYFGTQEAWTDDNGGIHPFVMRHIYPTILVISVVWLLALAYFVANTWLTMAHERYIQREMSRELDLERLRLIAQVDLEQKVKRSARLSDDREQIEPEQIHNTTGARHVQQSD